MPRFRTKLSPEDLDITHARTAFCSIDQYQSSRFAQNALLTSPGYGLLRSAQQHAEIPPGCGDCGTLSWMNVNRKRMQVFYSGNVQGVGFRYTAKTVATGFEITGTVRNLPDGRVELVAEGLKEELDAFGTAIRDSGLGHFIAKEHVSWSDAQNEFRGFEIVR